MLLVVADSWVVSFWKEWWHVVAVLCVNVGDVEVLIAFWADSSPQNLLDQDVISVREIEDEIDGQKLVKHFGLPYCTGDAIEDEACRLGIGTVHEGCGVLLQVPDNLDDDFIVNELASAQGIADLL